MKIRAVGAELHHAHRRTYRRDGTNGLFFFFSFAKKPKNVQIIHSATQCIPTVQKQFVRLS